MDWLSDPNFWLAVGQIIMIDVLLGGDNAVVIALACRRLPPELRRQGIFWGTAGAIVLRVVLMSLSSLFYIIIAQWLFGKTLRLVPLSGYAAGLDLVKFLALPLLVGIVYQLGSEARLFRAMLLEEAGKDYVRTARSKGLAEPAVLFGHVLRNAWLPIITHVGALLPYAFLGSIVFESFFGIPGIGTWVVEAIGAQDFAIVHTMVFIGSALYIAAYLATDIAYTFVDPRVRLS